MDLEFVALDAGDAPGLAAMLAEASAGYLQYFQPFTFAEEALRRRLQERRADQYWGLRYQGTLAGFCMLRGFDEGYARPAFGVFVAEKFSGRRLATRALQHCIAWCRTEGVLRIMLKVHPDNAAALAAYRRAGFRFTEICPRSQQQVLELRLEEAAAFDLPGGEVDLSPPSHPHKT